VLPLCNNRCRASRWGRKEKITRNIEQGKRLSNESTTMAGHYIRFEDMLLEQMINTETWLCDMFVWKIIVWDAVMPEHNRYVITKKNGNSCLIEICWMPHTKNFLSVKIPWIQCGLVSPIWIRAIGHSFIHCTKCANIVVVLHNYITIAERVSFRGEIEWKC
jgi:hypothetical protein